MSTNYSQVQNYAAWIWHIHGTQNQTKGQAVWAGNL